MDLKYKLTLIFAATLLLLMALTVVMARHAADLTVEADLRERMMAAATSVQRALNREIHVHGTLDRDSAIQVTQHSLTEQRHIPLVSSLTRIEMIYWLGASSDGFSMNPNEPPGREKAGVRRGTSSRSYRQQYVIQLNEGYTAKLGLVASLQDADTLAARLTRVFLIETAIALMLLLGCIYVLSYRLVSAPLHELSSMTRKVAEGTLDVLPTRQLRKRRDEVGVLSESFQDMLSALRRARDENQALLRRAQDFNRQLEARVSEATAALAERNEMLLQAREELTRQEKLAALGQLAGSIAHEIGTPLSTLSGYLQLVLADPGLSPDLQEPLRVAAGESQRMTRIIRRFLDSTRGLRPTTEPIDLDLIVRNTIELTLPTAMRDRHPIVISISPEVGQPVTDPGLLRQVLINLINNAMDAMGERGALEVYARREDASLIIDVADEGPGIPQEDQERIFEAFFTTKAAGRGTGLGLAISREIARALRGSLTVRNRPSGKGAMFSLSIVAYASPTDTHLNRGSGRDPGDGPPISGGPGMPHSHWPVSTP